MPIGKVKWYNQKKGFGILVGPDGRDCFLHYTRLKNSDSSTLVEGKKLSFEILETAHHPHAMDVVPV